MSRILIVVPPLVGHVNPTVPVGVELEERGHHVAWAGLPEVVDRLLPEGAHFVPVTGGWDRAAYARIQERSRGLRGAAALKFLWQDFLIPLARATAADVERAIDACHPDLLVIDQQAVGAAAVARRRALPWVTSATTSAELTNPLAELPTVDAWVRRQLHDLQLDVGVDPARAAIGDLRFSEHAVLAFSTQELAGTPAVPVGDRVRFVGPSLRARPETTPFPWDWIDPSAPLVLVSLGTVNAEVGGRFYSAAVDAFSQLPVQAVLVAPGDTLAVRPPAERILVAERVPQLALLRRCRAVVSHGGHNTVCEALAEGLPLVLAPIRDDQPIVAEQVVRAGAGIRVRFGRVRAAELAEAVQQVLAVPAYREGAARIAASFATAGGAAAAADAVQDCLQGVRVA